MRSIVFVLAMASGCELVYEPDVGAALSTSADAGTDDSGGSTIGCGLGDSNPDATVSFSANIRPLMTRSPGGCIPCHLGRVTSGLDLSSYESLRRGGVVSGTRLVIPRDPCNSILPKKLGRTPPFGSRMPFNGPPFFTVEEVQLVRDWIAEGAPNN